MVKVKNSYLVLERPRGGQVLGVRIRVGVKVRIGFKVRFKVGFRVGVRVRVRIAILYLAQRFVQ